MGINVPASAAVPTVIVCLDRRMRAKPAFEHGKRFMVSNEKHDEDGIRPVRQEPVIVAIGASAGGIRALQSFFSVVPADTGAAFVVVVHLDPEHRSEMPNILASYTRMPVS